MSLLTCLNFHLFICPLTMNLYKHIEKICFSAQNGAVSVSKIQYYIFLGLIQPLWNGIVLAHVNRAEIALYEVAETNTQRGYFGKMKGCFGF